MYRRTEGPTVKVRVPQNILRHKLACWEHVELAGIAAVTLLEPGFHLAVSLAVSLDFLNLFAVTLLSWAVTLISSSDMGD